MPVPSEFDGHTQRNGIHPPITPDGKPGHIDLTVGEKLRLQYGTNQPADVEQDSTRKSFPEAFQGLEELPKNIRKPKYATPRWKGSFAEDDS